MVSERKRQHDFAETSQNHKVPEMKVGGVPMWEEKGLKDGGNQKPDAISALHSPFLTKVSDYLLTNSAITLIELTGFIYRADICGLI